MSEKRKIYIAIMGPTGTGKSTFINKCTKSSTMAVGTQLRSCTSDIQTAEFELDEYQITLIDSPGFDDTKIKNSDVLKTISDYLKKTYEKGTKLSGVLYFHRISDRRMGGIAIRNFGVFRRLCGNDNLKNIVIVTNMWKDVDEKTGSEREQELKSQEDFFKLAMDQNAKMCRHDDTTESAHGIILRLLKNQAAALKIQVEMVDEKKELSDTSAGMQVNEELRSQAKKHREEMEQLRQETEEAAKERDGKTVKELKDAIASLKSKIEDVEKAVIGKSSANNDHILQRGLLLLIRLGEVAVTEYWRYRTAKAFG